MIDPMDHDRPHDRPHDRSYDQPHYLPPMGYMSVMQDHSIRAGKFDEAYLRTPLLFLLLGYVVGQRFSSVTGYIQNHHFFGIVYIQVIQKI